MAAAAVRGGSARAASNCLKEGRTAISSHTPLRLWYGALMMTIINASAAADDDDDDNDDDDDDDDGGAVWTGRVAGGLART